MNKDKYEKFKNAAYTLDDPQYIKGYHLGLLCFCEGGKQAIDGAIKTDWSKSYAEGFKDGEKGKSPKGIDGRIANSNQKGFNADTKLFARINKDEKAMFQALAGDEGKSLSEWVLEACRQKAKKS
jgi:hypothetical protein